MQSNEPSGDAGRVPDLSELIQSVRDARGYSYRQLAERSDDVITHARWGQLGKGTRIIEFPEPATIAAIAKALDVNVSQVVLSVAVTVGLPIRATDSDLAAMLPASARSLTPAQRDAILAVVKAMNPPGDETGSATVRPIRPIDDPTQFAGMSGTAPLPAASPSDRALAAHEKRPGSTPVQDARDEQDKDYPDEEGPEGGA